MTRSIMLIAAGALVVAGALACNSKTDEYTGTDSYLSDITFPLFSPDAEKEYGRLRKARKAKGMPESVLTDAIDWAPTLDEAFARATKADKPVLLVTYVRENGDPLCDV